MNIYEMKVHKMHIGLNQSFVRAEIYRDSCNTEYHKEYSIQNRIGLMRRVSSNPVKSSDLCLVDFLKQNPQYARIGKLHDDD